MVIKKKPPKVIETIEAVRKIGERYWHNGVSKPKAHLREESGRLLNSMQHIFRISDTLAIAQPYMQSFMVVKLIRKGLCLPTYRLVVLNSDTDLKFCDEVIAATDVFLKPRVMLAVD